jgi:hypothetical protein
MWALWAAAAPAPALAQGCPCTGLQAIVRAAAEYVVSGVSVPVERSVRESAAWGAGELHKDLAAIREAVLYAGGRAEAAVAAADKSSAERQLERTYEAGSQPPSICGGDALGAGYQLSEATRARAAADVLARAASRGERFRRPVDFQEERLAGGWPGPQEAGSLLGAAGPPTLTPEGVAGAERAIEALSGRFPPPELEGGALSTPAGRAYEDARREFLTRQALFQSALARLAAGRAPTVEGLEGWARGKWEEMGGAGDPPGLEGGRLSQEALFWYLANMRLGSANWHEETLASLPEAGLLRELASMQAVGLELLRRQGESLDLIAGLLAASGLGELEGAPREALRALHSRAAGSGG